MDAYLKYSYVFEIQRHPDPCESVPLASSAGRGCGRV